MLWGVGWDVEFRSSEWEGGEVCERLRRRIIDDRNLQGRMLLEFCLEKELCVLNTWFKKEESDIQNG